ncbi:LysR family transcriptional regulator [Novosphingobium flavum]|uniref:LysR family transcriptional regulator n=1 Tax=Novosphingobium flavum TaxID=1778672 RepID=A0A7X1FSC8_9SPHN|nr:LysR family transcriptional regulator [Novosphingobium flavum]MBC2666076.1 LysR family transcriptional regulator [Novosphingobium flavum]
MITELRTFVAIARHGTFASAAGRVGLTQAAVSAQMKRLEEHLGLILFDRTGRSAKLNGMGERTLPRAEAILGLFDKLSDPEAGSTTTMLRIGAIASVQSSILARGLVSFRQRYPECSVHVFPGLSLHLVDQVDSGELDLAIMIRPPIDLPPDMTWHSLMREPYVLIAHAETKGDDWQELLQTQPFLRYHRLSAGGRLVNRFLRTLPFSVKEAVEIPLQAMMPMVQNGLGVALIPVSERHMPLPAGIRTVPLGDADLYREIGFVRSVMSAPDPVAGHLADCLINAVDP